MMIYNQDASVKGTLAIIMTIYATTWEALPFILRIVAAILGIVVAVYTIRRQREEYRLKKLERQKLEKELKKDEKD